MSNTVQITFRIDEELKNESSEFFNACGLSLSQGIQLLLKKALNDGEVLIRPKYQPQTLKAMEESRKIVTEPQKYKGYQTAEEMMNDILKVAEDAENYTD